MSDHNFVQGYLATAIEAELPEAKPRPGAVEGDPHESQMILYEDELITVGVWECSPGRFPGSREGYNELMVFIKGAGTLTTPDGTSSPIEPGTVYPSLDGWEAEWNLTKTTRKVWVVWGRK